MERVEKIVITTLVIVVLVAGFYYLTGFISSTTGYVIKSHDPETVSECLKNREIVFYTAPSCPDCDKQNNELSKFTSEIDTVDCSQNAQACLVLTQLPAFEYQKSLYYGFKTEDELRSIVKC